MKYNIPLIGALLLLAACSTDDSTTVDSMEELPIILRSNVSQETVTPMRGTEAGVSHITAQGTNQVLAAGQHVDLFLSENVATATTPTYTGGKYFLKTTAPSGADDAGVGNFTFYTDEARTSAVTRYWPPSGNGLYFYAYYPAGAIAGPVTPSTTTAQTFTVAAGQGTAAASNVYDLMFGVPNANPIGTAASNPIARPTAATMAASAVNLNFRHCLSKVVVILKGDGYGIGNGTTGGPATGANAHKNGYYQNGVNVFGDATVTLGTESTDELYLQASVVPSTGVATALTTGTTGVYTIKAGTNAETTNFCIVPPGQTLTGKKINLALTSGGTKSFTIPQVDTDDDDAPDTDVVAQAGKMYTYTVTVGLYSISVTSTVGDWTDEVVTGGTLKY